MKMKKLNKRGSILQIVLVIFLIMTFALTSCLFLMRGQISNHLYINLLMKQKNFEILLINYYTDQMQNDILISDDFEDSQYEVYYTVDDLGDFYEVITHIESKVMNYSFLVNMTIDTCEVIKFEYMEG